MPLAAFSMPSALLSGTVLFFLLPGEDHGTGDFGKRVTFYLENHFL
jgi:hypothetical protein